MTFKAIFEQHNFDIYLDSDFCVILMKDQKLSYVVYKNMGVRCLDLITLNDVDITILNDRWKLKDFSLSSEEYDIKNSIDKTYLINYIFGLISFDSEICPELPNYDYWKDSLVIRKEENKPALLMSDSKQSNCNILIFDSNSYRLLLPNTNCYLLKENGQKRLLISFNPYNFLSYISVLEINEYATLILPLNVTMNNLNSLLSRDFADYNFICSTIEEYIEVLRFCCYYLNLTGAENVHLDFVQDKGEISFWNLPENSILKYVQLGSDMQKNLRSLIGGNGEVDSFRTKRETILNTKIISMAFSLTFKELEVLIDNIISTYNLPCKVL